MPILDNEFTCPNGHKFNANAKVRARCPECGTLTKRFGRQALPPQNTDTPVASDPIAAVSTATVTLLRKGKRSMAPAKTPPAKKPIRKGGPPKGVIPPQFRKNVASRTTSKPVTTGVVRAHPGVRKAAPQITKRPKRTAVARVTKAGNGGSANEPIWKQVAGWLGF